MSVIHAYVMEKNYYVVMQTFNMLIPHELYAPFIKQKYAYTIAVLKYEG